MRQNFRVNGIVIDVWTNMVFFVGLYIYIYIISKAYVDHWCFDGLESAYTPTVVVSMKLNVLVGGECAEGFVITVVGVESTG